MTAEGSRVIKNNQYFDIIDAIKSELTQIEPFNFPQRHTSALQTLSPAPFTWPIKLLQLKSRNLIVLELVIICSISSH